MGVLPWKCDPQNDNIAKNYQILFLRIFFILFYQRGGSVDQILSVIL